MKPMLGSLGVIERFFDAQLVASMPRRSSASCITPNIISSLPESQLTALADRISEHLYSKGGSRSRSTGGWKFVLADKIFDPWRPFTAGMRALPYIGNVMVDDPVESWKFRLPRQELSIAQDRTDIMELLHRVAKVGPLIRAGYIGLFPPSLIEQHGHNLPEIEKETLHRAAESFRLRHEHWARTRYETRMCSMMFMDAEMRRGPHREPLLEKLATSVDIGTEIVDATSDKFISKFLGSTIESQPVHTLARIGLPKLDKLEPADLASLMAGDEVLESVRNKITEILSSLPEGLNSRAEAVEYLDKRLSDELEGLVESLNRRLRRSPSTRDIVVTAIAISASIYVGLRTNAPQDALIVGGAGAAPALASAWLNAAKIKGRNKLAMRVLKQL